MINETEFLIDEETIISAGLRLSEKPMTSQYANHARVFEFPTLQNVFVMERDFYGNPLPKGSCFLAFEGRHGLLGTDLPLEKLRNASTEDIKKLVQRHS